MPTAPAQRSECSTNCPAWQAEKVKWYFCSRITAWVPKQNQGTAYSSVPGAVKSFSAPREKESLLRFPSTPKSSKH